MPADEPVPEFDLYEELEVSRSASTETIAAAYRSLVKRNHPDTTANAKNRIKRLNVAHEWLTEPAKRRLYDSSRPVHGGSACPVFRSTRDEPLRVGAERIDAPEDIRPLLKWISHACASWKSASE